MAYSEEQVKNIIEMLLKEMKISKSVEVIYRDDYRDFQVVLDGSHHCEIREKLIDDYAKTKNSDVVREMKYLLKNAAPFEEWEGGTTPKAEKEEKMIIDDKDQYDF